MKVSSFALAIALTFIPAIVSTANSFDQCDRPPCRDYLRTGTAFEIAEQYANGGQYNGVTPGTTGTALDIARVSLDYFVTIESFASPWRVPPIVAKGK